MKTKPQSKFLNLYVDSWAVPFLANLSLFPKCQGALDKRPGVCAVREDKAAAPFAHL